MSRIRLVGKLLVLSLAVVLICDSVGFAQQQRGRGRGGQFGGPGGFGAFGGRGGMDALTLVGNEQVQTELKIRDDQKPKIDEIRESVQSQRRELFGNLGDLSREERAERFREQAEKMREATASAEGKLKDALSSEQWTRLEQIQIQLRGIDALRDEEVAKKLDIDAEQSALLDGILATRREEQRKLTEGLREGGREGARERFQEIRTKTEEINKKAETEALAVLTDAQKSQFTALKGAPFELERRGFGRGRGGQDGQRGQRGRGQGRPGGGRRPNTN